MKSYIEGHRNGYFLVIKKEESSEKRELKKSETKKSYLEENCIEKSIQNENYSKVEESVENLEKSMTEKLEAIEVNEMYKRKQMKKLKFQMSQLKISKAKRFQIF